MIKVTVKDRDLLPKITIEQIIGYIGKNKWEKGEDKFNQQEEIIGSYWHYREGDREHIVLVPSNENARDYVARITEIIYELEKIEQRSQIEIYVDLTGIPIIVNLSPKSTYQQ